MVNKCAGATGAAVVHACVKVAPQKEDFRVLAAQLDNGIGAGMQLFGADFFGKNLLHELDTTAFSNADACAAANGQARCTEGGEFGHKLPM